MENDHDDYNENDRWRTTTTMTTTRTTGKDDRTFEEGGTTMRRFEDTMRTTGATTDHVRGDRPTDDWETIDQRRAIRDRRRTATKKSHDMLS